MPSPVGARPCQLYHGQPFDGVPWLMNSRLRAHFNLFVLRHMSLINVLIRPGKTHSFSNHLWAGPFLQYIFHMLNILITGDFFFYVMFSCSCHQISWSGCFRACHVWHYWHYNKQLYFHFSSHCLSAMYYPWNYFSLTPNQRLRRGQMAGFKQLSTDEWSYLPGHWTLFLRVASFGPLT